MRRVAMAAVMVLAGCGAEPTEPAPQRADPAAPGFRLERTAGGAELVLDAPRLGLGCRAGDLYVRTDAFQRIGSEERLTVGAGEVLATLVVDLQAPGTLIEAQGQRPDGFLEALAAGKGLGLSYGARQLAFPDAPPPEVGAAFRDACR